MAVEKKKAGRPKAAPDVLAGWLKEKQYATWQRDEFILVEVAPGPLIERIEYDTGKLLTVEMLSAALKLSERNMFELWQRPQGYIAPRFHPPKRDIDWTRKGQIIKVLSKYYRLCENSVGGLDWDLCQPESPQDKEDCPYFLSAVRIPAFGERFKQLPGRDELQINTFLGNSGRMEKGEFPTIRKIFAHAFGRDVDWAWEWMRVLWHEPTRPLPIIFLTSKETGTGKSSVGTAISAIIGPEGAGVYGDNDLNNGFNPWYYRAFVNFDDLSDVRSAYDMLKKVITAPTLTVNEKFKAQKSVVNCCHVFMSTNRVYTSLTVTEEERRLWPFEVKKFSEENRMDDGTFRKTIEQEAIAVRYWLEYEAKPMEHPRLNDSGVHIPLEVLHNSMFNSLVDVTSEVDSAAGIRDTIDQMFAESEVPLISFNRKMFLSAWKKVNGTPPPAWSTVKAWIMERGPKCRFSREATVGTVFRDKDKQWSWWLARDGEKYNTPLVEDEPALRRKMVAELCLPELNLNEPF